MKICTIVGARPQFIKAAALSRKLRLDHQEVLIHTGQHYDYNMSEIFFDELEIPTPDYNLGISGGSHGKMTGDMLVMIEQVLINEDPDMVLVYGDTNSTLAGALAAVKLHIPICHVEAGIRMQTLDNPEEINRILTDRISKLLFCCTDNAVINLKQEGIFENVYNTGDLMYDAALYYNEKMEQLKAPKLLGFDGDCILIPNQYYLLTCHREENTKKITLLEVFSAMNQLEYPVIYPVHPRNTKLTQEIKSTENFENIILVPPVGYLTSLYLVKHAKKIITDSGGLQREAWFFDVPCVTLLDFPLWPETFVGNMNQLCSVDALKILKALEAPVNVSAKNHVFGDGHAAEKIVTMINQYFNV